LFMVYSSAKMTIQIPFLALALGVFLIVSVLFLTRSKIAAIIFSVVDLVAGLTLVGSKEIAASIFVYHVPEIVVLYIGAAMTLKGVYYLVLSLR